MTAAAPAEQRVIWNAISRFWLKVYVPFFQTLLILGILAGIFSAIYFPVTIWHRGNYAGFHFGDGQAVASRAMIATYGQEFASNIKYATPPVYNTHFNNVVQGTGQVRVYQMIGARGVHYCVSVWNPGPNWTKGHKIDVGAEYQVVKGCTFK